MIMMAAFMMSMVLPQEANADVWISTNKSAKKYHKSKDCRAINYLDKKLIKSISQKEAENMGRSGCKFCYGTAAKTATAKKTTTTKKATTTAKKKVEEPKEEAKTTAKKATTTTKKATTTTKKASTTTKKKVEDAEEAKPAKKATTTTKKKATTTTKKATTKKKDDAA